MATQKSGRPLLSRIAIQLSMESSGGVMVAQALFILFEDCAEILVRPQARALFFLHSHQLLLFVFDPLLFR